MGNPAFDVVKDKKVPYYSPKSRGMSRKLPRSSRVSSLAIFLLGIGVYLVFFANFGGHGSGLKQSAGRNVGLNRQPSTARIPEPVSQSQPQPLSEPNRLSSEDRHNKHQQFHRQNQWNQQTNLDSNQEPVQQPPPAAPETPETPKVAEIPETPAIPEGQPPAPAQEPAQPQQDAKGDAEDDDAEEPTSPEQAAKEAGLPKNEKEAKQQEAEEEADAQDAEMAHEKPVEAEAAAADPEEGADPDTPVSQKEAALAKDKVSTEAKAPTEQPPKHPSILSPEVEHANSVVLSPANVPAAQKTVEYEDQAHMELEQIAENLPESLYVPFEDATRDEVLLGWEDEWVSSGNFDVEKWGNLQEEKIDFVYLWVNGSETAFQETKHPYELNSVLNDKEGTWINSHGTNRYRDWDELRYSFRSIEKNAGHFRNKMQVLVNAIYDGDQVVGKQTPTWLKDDSHTADVVKVLKQEDFFDKDKAVCLPTFNSLTIENQIFNVPSDVDKFFALSDDMMLTSEHSSSDIYSPLFGNVMSFKTNSYSTTSHPTDVDAKRFGEKPYLIYTSWLLNRRFGSRKRKGQSHLGHSLSRNVMREAISAFPGPELFSACKRFRGEPGFQLYSWYASYHYLMERHREALLWSYIMLRSDVDGDGSLSWPERQAVMLELEAGMANMHKTSFRRKNFYHMPAILEKAGLAPPKVNTNILWTSLDGPVHIRDADCAEFNINECLAPGFSTSQSDTSFRNPVFSSALIFDRLAHQNVKCGDCFMKILLHQQEVGLEPLLPKNDTQIESRELVVKALMRYKYTVVDPTDSLFVMVTDADQVDSTLTRPYVREGKHIPGQMCLNDDVATEDEQELNDVKQAMTELFQGLFPEKSQFEI